MPEMKKERSEAILAIRGLQKSFGETAVLRDISLSVEPGNVVSIIGPSGSGKSTLLRCASFLETADGGDILYDGQYALRDGAYASKNDLNRFRTLFGMVFQSFNLFPHYSVMKNICEPPVLRGKDREQTREKAVELLRKMGLEGKENAYPCQLSGGQQQRVAIARALVTGPAIICMDEPLSNLDAKLRVNLRNELKKMQREFGITTIYVTHDQEEALTLSDRIAVFNKGYIEQIGTPNEVYNHSETEFVANFIGDINRLGDEIVASMGLPAGKAHYIRLERIGVRAADTDGPASAGDSAVFTGVIESQEYYGLFIKYSIQAAGQTLKVVEKNDGINIYNPGDSVTLRISPADIMSY